MYFASYFSKYFKKSRFYTKNSYYIPIPLDTLKTSRPPGEMPREPYLSYYIEFADCVIFIAGIVDKEMCSHSVYAAFKGIVEKFKGQFQVSFPLLVDELCNVIQKGLIWWENLLPFSVPVPVQVKVRVYQEVRQIRSRQGFVAFMSKIHVKLYHLALTAYIEIIVKNNIWN